MKKNEDIIPFMGILFISLLFMSATIFLGKLAIPSADPAIKYWWYVAGSNALNEYSWPTWDFTGGMGRSVFTTDIIGTPYSAAAIFLSFFENKSLAYSVFIFIQVLLLGYSLKFYSSKYLSFQKYDSIFLFTIILFATGFLNEYFLNGFGGYFILPFVLDRIHSHLKSPDIKNSIIIGFLLAFAHWWSNASVSQFVWLFAVIFSLYLVSVSDYSDAKRRYKDIIIMLVVAGIIYVGLFAFFLFPFMYENITSARSHLYSFGGGFDLKKIILWLFVPFTAVGFMDEKMIYPGFLTSFESLNVFFNILLGPAIVLFFLNRKIFTPVERFFFYFIVSFLVMGWLNKYIPVLDVIVRAIKGTGWWRSIPLYFISSGLCIAIVAKSIHEGRLQWLRGKNNYIKRLSQVAGIGFIVAAIAFFLVVFLYPQGKAWAIEVLSRLSVRSYDEVSSYFVNYYFAQPYNLYITLALSGLGLSLVAFSRLGVKGGAMIVLLVGALVGQYSITNLYYPFNSGVSKVSETKEAEFLKNYATQDRAVIVFNKLSDVENFLKKNKGYAKNNMDFAIATQRFPEVTRIQSNNSMHGSFFSSIGPSVYTKGTNFTDAHLVKFHLALLEGDEYFFELFKNKKGYMRLGPASTNSGLLDMAGINLVLSSLEIENPVLKKIFEGDQYFIYENSNAYPKVYIAERIIPADKEQIFNVMKNSSAGIKKTAVVSDSLNLEGINEISSKEMSMSINSDQSISIIADAGATALLVLNQMFHDGWRAYVDGKEVTVLRVNGINTGIKVEKGKHNIKFVYSQPFFIFGILVSLITVVLCLSVYFINKTGKE